MRHYRIFLPITHITELLLWTHKCHKLEWMRHCCTVTCCAVADHPCKKGCTFVVKWRDSPTSHSAQSLTWIRYFELRVTETLVLQAQTARLAIKTPNLQARSHWLFTPEHPSCKHFIKLAFFSIKAYLLHHFSFLTCCKASPDVPFLRHWNAGLRSYCNGQKPGVAKCRMVTLGLLNRSSSVAWLKMHDICKSPSSKNSSHSAFWQASLKFRWIMKTSVLLI